MKTTEKISQITKNYIKGLLFGHGLKRWWTFNFYPNVHPSARLGINLHVVRNENLIMAENSSLKNRSNILNDRAKFIIKKNSGAAEDLLIITGNHMSIPGLSMKQVTNDVKDKEDKNHEYDKDVVIDEDVWIGASVTILSGVHVGRGCEIGTGAVLRQSTPPYSIVIGNPAKIVGFRFTPEEIVVHEKALYPEGERIPYDLLNRNYEKYAINRIREIKQYIKM